jgi:predicted PurR-regulated permease PerM
MKYNKIPYIKLLPIIFITLVLYRVVNNFENVGDLIGKFFSLISYFIWGFSIAYLLNPLMLYIEEKTKVKRFGSLIVVYAFFIGILTLICVLIVPIIVKNLLDLINNMPNYIKQMQIWSTDFFTNNKYLNKTMIASYFNDNISGIIKNANNYIGQGLNMLFKNLINLSNLIIKIATGIVISIYFLKDKENLLKNIKKFIIALVGIKKAKVAIDFGGKVNSIFKHFVIGKLIDSVIVGLIYFIVFIILKIPFAVIISIIIGVTNMIPYFGGFIGMAPAVAITLFTSPVKALEVVVLMLVIGEIDGLFIGPKIIGQKIGLNPLWIILGITLGGGFYGVVGMFLGVPFMAVVKILLQELMKRKLKEDELKEVL